ncbi:MAG: cyclic 2,3-diphosphoglycerate synthase [Acidobacteriia bacterium]|nr:cyclic 2,3-diphosphoglycerate synthase [Terriglobia bacterium]
MAIRVIIMGAAGRDFHNFNTYYRDNPAYEVVAFTATQIPNIDGRVYPAALAGSLYPNGIPIYPESELRRLIAGQRADEVVFAYSDVPHEGVMHKASAVLAAGADFRLMGPNHTQVRSTKPVVSVNAVRTGAGKSPTSRRVADVLQQLGYKVVAIRHPMPYGDLAAQAVQRFATLDDLERFECTIEEREEYEPHIVRGVTIYAGVDYERILREAEKEADVILWDGGNNDFSFYRSDLTIVVADPHRAGHELTYHPGETNFRSADVIVINKVDTAPPEAVTLIRDHVYAVNPEATIVEAASPIMVEDARAIRGKRVLVIEDGPTLTHGEMAYGAGYVAARRYGGQIVDPHEYAVGSIAATYARYKTTGPVLPAMGYSDTQVRELEETIARTPCDLVLIATPIDLRRVLLIGQPSQRVRYEIQEIGEPTLFGILREKFGAKRPADREVEHDAVLA